MRKKKKDLGSLKTIFFPLTFVAFRETNYEISQTRLIHFRLIAEIAVDRQMAALSSLFDYVKGDAAELGKRCSDRIYNTRRDESVRVHALGRKTILRLNLSRWLDAHRRRRCSSVRNAFPDAP